MGSDVFYAVRAEMLQAEQIRSLISVKIDLRGIGWESVDWVNLA
jgi:hypothetical protein